MTIKTKGTQTFNVPNTPEGREFLHLAGKFLNRHAFERMFNRGRGSRVAAAKRNGYRPRAFDQDLPVGESDWLAAYAVPVGSSWSSRHLILNEGRAMQREDDAFERKTMLDAIDELSREREVLARAADEASSLRLDIAAARTEASAIARSHNMLFAVIAVGSALFGGLLGIAVGMGGI